MKTPVRKLTTMAMLTAISIVLVWLIRFPMFAPFLEYDPADIPIFIGTFLYGPLAGLGLTFVTAVIQGFTVSSGAGIIGILMHFVATGTFALLAGGIYKRWHTHMGALVATVSGVFAMTAIMVLWNLLLTPLYMGTPVDAVLKMLVPVIIPFNLFKAGLNGAVTYLVYIPITRLLRREYGQVAI